MGWLVWGAAAFVTAVIVVVIMSGPPKDHWNDDDYR